MDRCPHRDLPTSSDALRRYGEEVSSHHGTYSSEGAVDVVRLLGMLGGRHTPDTDFLELHVYRPGEFTVYLPRFQGKNRNRFSIAHVLGHYFVHYRAPRLDGEKTFHREECQGRVNVEANLFAVGMLLPEEKFRLAWESSGGNVWHLAGLFEVAPAMVRHHGEVLGLKKASDDRS